LTPPSFRLKREIINRPLVSIIIPTFNRADLVKVCIESIERKTTYKNYEIILVDNNSNESYSLSYFDKISKKHTVLKYSKPFNYAAINNFAVKHAKGEHILLLNNDTEVINGDWIEAMLEYSQLPEIGAVGAKLLYPDDSIQHAGVILGIGGVAGHSHKYFLRTAEGYIGRVNSAQNISAVTGACLMVKKSIFKEVGGLDEQNLAVAFNDVDLCLKIHSAGYRNVYTPFAELYHYESISRGYEDKPEKIKRFEKEKKFMMKKWSKLLKNDPNYNPNLTFTKEDFSLNLE
jgi:GT2 family glycosyltransferase